MLISNTCGNLVSDKSSAFLTSRAFENKNIKYKHQFQDMDVIDLVNFVTGIGKNFHQIKVRIKQDFNNFL